MSDQSYIQDVDIISEPKDHPRYVDTLTTAVGYGIYEFGFQIFINGQDLGVHVPNEYLDETMQEAVLRSNEIFNDYASAANAVARAGASSLAVRARPYACYLSGAYDLVVPTVFSPATTPRIIRTLRECRAILVTQVQSQLKLQALALGTGIVLNSVLSVVLRAGSGEVVPMPKSRVSTGGKLTRSEMLKHVLQIFRNNPLLKRLQASRKLSGQVQQKELINILTEFERTTGTTVQRVPKGTVSATRGAGNYASLRSRPGMLQIEEQVFSNPGQLQAEVQHELSFYYTGMKNQAVLGESGAKAHELVEWIIEHGEDRVIKFLTD